MHKISFEQNKLDTFKQFLKNIAPISDKEFANSIPFFFYTKLE